MNNHCTETNGINTQKRQKNENKCSGCTEADINISKLAKMLKLYANAEEVKQNFINVLVTELLEDNLYDKLNIILRCLRDVMFADCKLNPETKMIGMSEISAKITEEAHSLASDDV